MSARPIALKPHEVRGVLAGRQTQVRRICRLPPVESDGFASYGKDAMAAVVRNYSPFGPPGDTLWCKETFCLETCRDIGWYEPPHKDGRPIKEEESEADGRWWSQPHYRATDPAPDLFYEDAPADPRCRWSPSIHMPRWASRITLEITGVRVERLREISEADARAEGVTDGGCLCCGHGEPCGCASPTPDARDSFAAMWESTNGPGSWDANPLVWVLEFKRIDQNRETT